MGLLEPSSGEVKIDGKTVNKKNINPIITKNWQKLISHVPQDIFLSDISLIENIANSTFPEQINFKKTK